MRKLLLINTLLKGNSVQVRRSVYQSTLACSGSDWMDARMESTSGNVFTSKQSLPLSPRLRWRWWPSRRSTVKRVFN